MVLGLNRLPNYGIAVYKLFIGAGSYFLFFPRTTHRNIAARGIIRVARGTTKLFKEIKMKCPQCDNEYVCPCPACREREPHLIPWIGEQDNQSCSRCGLTKSLDEWFDVEWEQYKQRNNESTAV